MNPRSRFLSLVVVAFVLLTLNGCTKLFGVKTQVSVPPLLSPLVESDTAHLIAEVNRLAAVRSIRGKVDIQFQDTSFSESGIAEKYRTADGTVILQRPAQIYLTIQAPFVGTDIAQMTSDGEHFRVAVLKGEEKYRRFVRGTNNAVYPQLEASEAQSKSGSGKNKKDLTDTRAVSVLSNLRPQHFTDALLVLPIPPRGESGYVYARSDFYQEEADPKPRARAGSRVVRGYYLLDELVQGGDGGVHINRRFWFDRVAGIRLARMQTFDNNGTLVTDVSYSDQKNFGEGGQLAMPAHIELTRPRDRYKIALTYQAPEAVVINHEYGADIFDLKNKWELPEYNLDAKK
jgi:uncharacterized protein YkuJ